MSRLGRLYRAETTFGFVGQARRWFIVSGVALLLSVPILLCFFFFVILNTAFVGVRVALNDVQSTDFVVSMLADLEHSTRSLVVEFNRRLTDQWSLHLEGLFILAVDEAAEVVHGPAGLM